MQTISAWAAAPLAIRHVGRDIAIRLRSFAEPQRDVAQLVVSEERDEVRVDGDAGLLDRLPRLIGLRFPSLLRLDRGEPRIVRLDTTAHRLLDGSDTP